MSITLGSFILSESLYTEDVENMYGWDSYELPLTYFKEDINKSCHGVYFIKNKVNNLLYIGSTTKRIATRLSSHISASNPSTLKNKSMISSAIQKIGIENFSYGLLEVPNKLLIRLRESQYISKLNTMKNGYNRNLPADPSLTDIEYLDKLISEQKDFNLYYPNCPNYARQYLIKDLKKLKKSIKTAFPELGSIRISLAQRMQTLASTIHS